jgi:hypothetical protein
VISQMPMGSRRAMSRKPSCLPRDQGLPRPWGQGGYEFPYAGRSEAIAFGRKGSRS